jgi:hypothetical protein
MIWLETIASFIMGTVGMYLLYRGKKIQEPKLMLWGAALIILSYFAFSWGGDDADSKAVLKQLMPSTTPTITEQPPQ